MKSAIHGRALRSIRARRLLRCGTALPLLLAACPAAAEPIAEQSSGDITVNADSASGTPVAVELSSTGGSVDASVTTVTGTAVAGDRDYVVGLQTQTDGGITGTFGSITGTGEGQLLGLGADTLDGDITLDVGTVDVTGSATAGIAATSVNGNVAIEADSVIARGTGEDSQHEFYEAVFGSSDTGSVTINVGSAETFGTYGSAIVAVAGDVATVTADSAIAHYQDTVAAYVRGANGASLDIGTIVETADTGQGAYVESVNGDASLTAGTITVGDFAQGARVKAAGDVAVTVGSITGGSGLYVDPTPGNVSISADSIDTYSTAIDASTISGGSLTIDAGILSSSIDSAATILANATDGGAITIDVDEATGAGVDRGTVYAVTEAGNVTVNAGTVTASGDGGVGIVAKSTDGDIAVAVGNVATTGLQLVNNHTPDGVYAETVNGTASVAVGSAAVEGFAASAAVALGGAGASITAESASSAGQFAAVLYAGSSGGDATVEAGTVTLRGDQQAGINAIADHGVAAVTVDTIANEGTLAVGVFARGGAGASVTSGTVDANRYGVWANALNGSAASIVTTGDTSVAGGFGLRGNGGTVSISTAADTLTQASTNAIWGQATETVTIDNQGTALVSGPGSAIFAQSNGSVSIVSTDAEAVGPGVDPGIDSDGMRIPQGGIVATAGGAVTIDADEVTVAGEFRYGIFAAGGGGVTINAHDVELDSADSVAVAGRSDAGAVSIATGTVTTTGASGVGVFGHTNSGDIAIVAGTTRVENEGMAGQFTGDAVVATSGSGAVSVTSADAFSAALNGSAVVAISGGDVTVDSGIAATTGDGGVAVLGQSNNGTLTLASDSVTTTGANTRAISAHAFNGVANVAIGDVTALGTNASGVLATGREVNLVVDGTIRSTQIAVNVAARGGLADVVVNGSIVSTDGPGLVSAAQDGVVTVSEGASVSGGTVGVVLLGGLQGGFTQFYNSGTVTGGTGAAVVGIPLDETAPVPSFYLQNNGTLSAGDSGIAVFTGAGNDVLELTNLSVIDGIANLGEGDDRLVLDLNDDAPAGAVGQVVSTVNVEGLQVDSGSWRAEGEQSEYDFIEIEDGATLTVVENAEGSLAVEAASVELDGELRLDLSVDETEGDLGETTISGIGSLHLIGTATVELTDATGLQHTGGTFVENGELLLTTVYGGDIATSGEGVFELAEGGDFTGDLVNDGTFVFSRIDDYSFLGDFTGSGQLDKHGDGTLTFAGLYGFVGTTSVFGGTVAFTGQLSEDTELDISEGTVDLSQVEGGTQTIAELSGGEEGTLQLGETQLIIEQFGDTVFAGSITGMGELLLNGEGELDLTGDGTGFTGTGQVDGGTLSVNGDLSNADFLVNEGGTLGGAGTIGDTSVDGGTLAPGNSIDMLTVNGDVTFTAASVFEVEVDPAGNSDLLQATGTATLGGAAVNVIAANGTYRPLTDYTILTAAGGVSGTFGSVQDNLAFLDPSLTYSANAVTLRLVRNDIDFAAFGTTANQIAVGGLIESFGYGNALYNETLMLADGSVAPSFASLTGEVYPAYSAGLIETAEVLRRQTADAAQVGEGVFVWGSGLYNAVDSGNGTGEIELRGQGLAGGLGYGAGGFSATGGIGKLDQDRGGSQFSDGEVTFAIGRLAYTGMPGLSFSAGAQFGWVDASTRRQTTLGAINQAVTGQIEGDYVQVFGEVAYRLPLGGGLGIEPFAGVSHISLDLDPVTETGAATALGVAAIDRKVTFADIGLRLSGEVGSGVRPFASAAYRHAWGDRASVAAFGFAGTAGTALVGAVPIAESAAELSTGLVVTRGMIDFKLGADATISKEFDSHGVNAGFKVRF